MFWKKKPEIVFSCVHENRAIFEALPPNHTAKFYPDWFKKLKPSYKRIEHQYNIQVDASTVKSCPGIKKTLTNGIIIPMWSDLVIDVYPDKSFNYLFSQQNSVGTLHDQKQLGGFAPDFSHLKLHSPWIAESSKSFQFYLTQPFYHTNGVSDFQIFPGFLDFYYSHATNVFIMFKHKPEPYRIFIPVGYPLIQLISTTQTLFDIKTKCISKDEWIGKDGRNISFVSSYNKFVKWFKQNEH